LTASASAIPPLGRCGVLDFGRGAVAVEPCGGGVVSVGGLVDVVHVEQLVHLPPEGFESALVAKAVVGAAHLHPQFFGLV